MKIFKIAAALALASLSCVALAAEPQKSGKGQAPNTGNFKVTNDREKRTADSPPTVGKTSTPTTSTGGQSTPQQSVPSVVSGSQPNPVLQGRHNHDDEIQLKK